jgi:IclR family pca regulon transcriptional regulator
VRFSHVQYDYRTVERVAVVAFKPELVPLDDALPAEAAASAAEDPNFMTSLARGLAVIRAFTEQEPELSIAEVARMAGISRAAARRCLHTLVRLGYAGSNGRTFFLRPKTLTLGYAFLSSASLPHVLQPFLERVSGSLRESSSAAVLDEDEIVYIARAATQRIMSLELNVGSRLPAYCTAMGRVLLAHLSAEELAAYLKRVGLKPLTDRTVTRRDALRRELDLVREKDCAIVDQELEIGLVSIAVPVRNVSGKVVAAINVSLHAGRVMPGEIEGKCLPLLRTIADEIKVQ